MSAIRSTRARRSLWTPPDASTSSSNAWPRRKRPRPRRQPPRRKRSSPLSLNRPQEVYPLRAVCFFHHVVDLRPYIEKFSRRLAEVEAALSDPKTFENKQRSQDLSREYSRLKDQVQTGHSYLKTVDELQANRLLAETEGPDS